MNLLLKSLLVRARNNFDAEFASADSTNTKCEYPLVRVISVVEFSAVLHDQLHISQENIEFPNGLIVRYKACP